MTQIIGCSIFLPFSIWHNYVTTFLLYRTCSRTRIPSSKIVRWYCLVWCFSYILCAFSTTLEAITISYTHYDYILLTGANRNQQLLRFASIITIGVMSILIVQVFPFIRIIFSFIIEIVALGVGYIINPFLIAAELKDTEGVWASKGHLLKPQIEDGKHLLILIQLL